MNQGGKKNIKNLNKKNSNNSYNRKREADGKTGTSFRCHRALSHQYVACQTVEEDLGLPFKNQDGRGPKTRGTKRFDIQRNYIWNQYLFARLFSRERRSLFEL